MTMARWEPFREMRRVQDTMDRLWRNFMPESELTGIEAWAIPIDVIEDDSSVTVQAAVPGIDPNQLELTLEDNVLTISGERQQQREVRQGRYLMKESAEGTFRRSLRLPSVIEAERAESRYENGVLTVTFPKQERSKARRIEVKAGQAQGQLEGQAAQPAQGERREQQAA